MKFKCIIHYCLLFLLISFSLYGQETVKINIADKQPAEQYLVGELFTGDFQSDTFLNSEWLQGEIQLETGGKVKNIYFRYNGLVDELFWRESGSGKIIKVDKEAVKGFRFNDFRGDSTVYFTRMMIKKDYSGDSTICFLQEVNFFNIKLFIYHSKFFLKRENYSVNHSTSIRDIYVEQPVYFIKYGSGLSVFKKFTRKTLCRAYPDKSDIIRKYIRSSASGRIRNLNEVISFLQFLDSCF
jgi:hypothetical protein